MRTFSLGTLVTACKQRVDRENSDFIATTEWKRMISSVLGRMHGELAKIGVRLFEAEQTITTVATTFATGTITCVTKAELVDGETFALHDGYGRLVFEFDVDGTGVLVAGNVQVNVSSDTTAETVEARIITAVNAATHSDGTAFKITASNGGSGIVALTNDVAGSAGNQVSFESVADVDFRVSHMLGGGGSYVLPFDHLSTVGIDYVSSGGERRGLFELMAQERNAFSSLVGGEAHAYELRDQFLYLWPIPPAGQTYKHVYIRQPSDFSSAPDGTIVDVVTPDGEEFVLWGVGVMALAKEESDPSLAMAERDAALERLVEWGVLRSLHEGRRRIVSDGYEREWDPADWRGR